jgi:chromosomal replication initiator protein
MPQLSAKDAWKKILDEAHRELPQETIRTWLQPAEPIALEDGGLVVGAVDQFAAEWASAKYADTLSRLAAGVMGRPTVVSFTVQEARRERPQMDLFVPQAKPAAGGAEVHPSTQPLNERYTFETFVIGKSNELAAAAAYAVAESPGKSYNPLFIYGPTGLGKTHLMQAIAHRVSARNPGTRVLFLVDDAHFLAGKETTQEEFFHTFNAFYEAKKQIVLTSDRPPKEIPGLEARLVSRFEWGMVADIGQPDLEHRIAILRKKQQQDHLETTVPDDVLRFIGEHVRSNVRELEGCIIKLLLFASLKHREITIDLAREALADKIRPEDGSGMPIRALPSIDRVQEVVARRWGVTPEGLRSKARIKTLTVPRQIAMYLARDLLQMQLVEIGQAFGGRDHSTVIHSVDKVQRQMQRDRSFRDRIELARQELTAAQ